MEIENQQLWMIFFISTQNSIIGRLWMIVDDYVRWFSYFNPEIAHVEDVDDVEGVLYFPL